MSKADLPPMDPDETYQTLLSMIDAEEPHAEDDILWKRISLSFSAAPPKQRHIDLLVEVAANKLLGQLTDTLCRLFMLDPKNADDLVSGPYQDRAAGIAALPQRTLDLRAARGVEFCEIVRQMIWERWAAKNSVPSWHAVHLRRDDELAREERLYLQKLCARLDESSEELEELVL